MKHQTWIAIGAAAVLLAACGGGDSRDLVTEGVSQSAQTDPVVATAQVKVIAGASAASTDSLDPAPVPDTLGTSETDEPVAIDN